MAGAPRRTLGERRPDVARRFYGHTIVDADGCRLWQSYAPDNVPRFYYRGAMPARRMALLLAGRYARRTADLRSRCGKRACVLAEHVFAVHPACSVPKRTRPNLSPETRAAIIRTRRETALTIPVIAAQFGVTPSTVSRLAGPKRTPKSEVAA